MVVDAIHGDKPRKKEDRSIMPALFSVDGLFRKENVLECPLWRLAQYLRHRSLMPGLSLGSNLCSQQQLLNYLDAPLYLTSHGSAYPKKRLLEDLDSMKGAAGVRREYGGGVHAWRNKALEESQLHHNDKALAERLLDHSGGIHNDHYAFCNYPNIKESAERAGHVSGHVRLYRTGLWASQSPKFRPLYDDVNWVGDKEYEVALQLVGHRRMQGTELWMNACRFLADTLLQDLVAVMRLTNMDSTILRERTADFPFLAPDHKVCLCTCKNFNRASKYYAGSESTCSAELLSDTSCRRTMLSSWTSTSRAAGAMKPWQPQTQPPSSHLLLPHLHRQRGRRGSWKSQSCHRWSCCLPCGSLTLSCQQRPSSLATWRWPASSIARRTTR